MQIDFNCDMGEGMQTDKEIMPFISSANIACGYHAGDEDTIKRTIELCLQYNVMIGAHPSFPDRENFGRKEMAIGHHALYDLITQQLFIIKKIADASSATLFHVKPHGALYNTAARDKEMAQVIAKAVYDFDAKLILFGLSGSCLITEANIVGLKTANEVFADRRYQDDGSLIPRSQPNALIENKEEAIEQALQMATSNSLVSVNGKRIAVQADTICIHGDGDNAVDFAKSIYEKFRDEGILIRPQ